MTAHKKAASGCARPVSGKEMESMGIIARKGENGKSL